MILTHVAPSLSGEYLRSTKAQRMRLDSGMLSLGVEHQNPRYFIIRKWAQGASSL
jgi:hypothetical protein